MSASRIDDEGLEMIEMGRVVAGAAYQSTNGAPPCRVLGLAADPSHGRELVVYQDSRGRLGIASPAGFVLRYRLVEVKAVPPQPAGKLFPNAAHL